MENTEVLNTAISEAAESLMESDEFKEILCKKVKSSLEDAVDSALRFGKARDAIKEKMEEGLALEIDNVQVPELFLFMSELVKNTVNKHYKNIAKEHLIKVLDEAITPMPKEITMQKLLNIVVDPIKENFKDYPHDFDENKTIEIEFDVDERHGSTWYTLKIWTEGKDYSDSLSLGSRSRQPQYTLNFRKGKLWLNPYKHADMFCDQIGQFYLMYAQGTIITDLENFNPDDADIDVSPYDC